MPEPLLVVQVHCDKHPASFRTLCAPSNGYTGLKVGNDVTIWLDAGQAREVAALLLRDADELEKGVPDASPA